MFRNLIKTCGKSKLPIILIMVSVTVIAVIICSACAKPDTENTARLPEQISKSKTCTECLALIEEIKSKDVALLMGEFSDDDGQVDQYSFISTYESLFKETRDSDATDFEIKFSKCSFMVAYTEFSAKRFQHYCDTMSIGNTMEDDAKKFRKHAEYLYGVLVNSCTEEDLQVIIDYCAENDIIYLK